MVPLAEFGKRKVSQAADTVFPDFVDNAEHYTVVVGEPTRVSSWTVWSVLQGHSRVYITKQELRKYQFPCRAISIRDENTAMGVSSLADTLEAITGRVYVARALVEGLVMKVCRFR